MLVLAAVLVLAALGIWLFCLFEVLSVDEAEARHLPKFAWFLIVLLGFELGAVAWLVFGRTRRRYVTADVTVWPPSYLMEPPEVDEPPRGPDDDPDFMRDLNRRLRGDD